MGCLPVRTPVEFAFNVAASIKMRKLDFDDAQGAEIVTFNVAASIKMRKSCSRRRKPCDLSTLQCGRIYKDAEIAQKGAHKMRRFHSFNVAASIKMRKCKYLCYLTPDYPSLQCGRIYKDAEIEKKAEELTPETVPSMWPHL